MPLLSDLGVVVLVFFYSLNLAPMIFESFTSDRVWASNPPESFYMFVGRFGQKTAHYWRVVSPLASLSFLACLARNWKAGAREWRLAAAFILHLAVQIPTMAYFVREHEALIAGSQSLGPAALKARADRWIALNYFRIVLGVLAFAVLLAAILVPAVP